MGKCGTLRCKGTTGIICKNTKTREWVEYCPVCRTETPVEAPRRPDAADRLASKAKADFEKAAYGQAEEGFLSAAQKTGDRARKEFYLWCSLIARYGVYYVDDDLHAKSYIPLFMRHPLPDFYLKRTEAYRGTGPADQKLADDLHMLLRKIDTQSDASFRVFVAWHGEECKPIAGEAANAISTSGYSAFCSVTTLDEKTADEYEPLIYTGLHQADVMAIVVDDLNALNAKFLSKEIERFHNRKKADDRLVTLLFALPGYTGHNTALPNSHVITLKGQTEKDCVKEIKEAVIGNLRDIRLQTIQQSQPRPAPRPKPLRKVLALLAAVCLLIGGGVLFKWWNDRSQPPQPSGEQGGVGVFAVETERADVTAEPTAEPTPEPTATPTVEPTPEPTATPTAEPTPEPTLSMAEEIALVNRQREDYELAEKLLLDNEYEQASALFAKLAGEGYSDAADRVNEPFYVQAEDLLAERDYAGASAAFLKAGDYSDAASRVDEPYFVQAEELLALADYEGALTVYKVLAGRGYEEAIEILLPLEKTAMQNAEYNNGLTCLHQGDYPRALRALYAAGDYLDAVDKAHFLQWALTGCLDTAYFHSAGVKTDGTIFVAGRKSGFLSDGSFGCYDLSPQTTSTEWDDIISVSTGLGHTVGLRKNGEVFSEGDNSYGQCNTQHWKSIVMVATGQAHTVGVKMDGTVIATGKNTNNQCDVHDWNSIVSIAAGIDHTVGLKKDGTVVAVGSNESGQCNVESWTDIVAITASGSHTIALRADGTLIATGNNNDRQLKVSQWSDVVTVDTSACHTVGLRADGTVVAIGSNDYGQCDVNDWSNIVAVAAGTWHTIGLKSDGTLVATGDNSHGQCDVSSWTNIGPNKAYLQTLFANTPQ